MGHTAKKTTSAIDERSARHGDNAAILTVRGLSKNFGGLEAVKNVHFNCIRGETLGIIGPNGAGKTTVFNLITGFIRPTRGQILFQSHDITGWKSADICRDGIARTFQNIRLFRQMTVWENVWIGQNHAARYLLPIPWLRGVDEGVLRDEAEALLDEYHLLAKREHLAGELAFGDMRRLEICRALATKPDILLLDEPASGMTPVETSQLMNDLRRLSRTGITIIIIEHDMNVALGLSDRVVVLNFGQLLAIDKPSKIRRNPDVIKAYLGSSAEALNA